MDRRYLYMVLEDVKHEGIDTPDTAGYLGYDLDLAKKAQAEGVAWPDCVRLLFRLDLASDHLKWERIG